MNVQEADRHEVHDLYRRIRSRGHDPVPRSSTVIPPGNGYGFKVEAGQLFRFVILEKAQILDVNMVNADEPDEHYDAVTQFALEGGRIGRLTGIWSNPPFNRRLAVCTDDTVSRRSNAAEMGDHVSHSAHCSAHFWHLYTGSHHRPCYDNLRAGMAMVGLSQRSIHSSMNLFMKGALSADGFLSIGRSDAEAGDFLEFYAEVPLLVVMSLCPSGSGEDQDELWDGGAGFPTYPVRVNVYEG